METRLAPPNIVNRYLVGKCRHETQFETYITDMLWAPANNMGFKEYPRYHEMLPQMNREIEAITKESVKERFLALLENSDA